MKKNIWLTDKELMERWEINAPTLAQYILDNRIKVHWTETPPWLIPPVFPQDLRGLVQTGPKGWTWMEDKVPAHYSEGNKTLGAILHFLDKAIFSLEDVLAFEAEQKSKVKKEAKFFDDPELIKLLKEVKPKMEFLFDDLQDMVGFRYTDNNTNREMNLQKRAIELLNDQENGLTEFFKIEFFKDCEIYNTDPKQTPRDFKGPLLNKIVRDQLHKEIGGQILYEIYKTI